MVNTSKRRLFTRKNDQQIMRPPWLKKTQVFTDECTRCGKCIETCETKIIQSGSGGFPFVDFSIDECTFCYQCAKACPEQLFLEQSAPPWNAKASVSDTCLTKHNVECRSCGDMCDTMAIQFKMAIGKTAQISLDEEKCTGCGACVASCPTTSIQVVEIS